MACSLLLPRGSSLTLQHVFEQFKKGNSKRSHVREGLKYALTAAGKDIMLRLILRPFFAISSD